MAKYYYNKKKQELGKNIVKDVTYTLVILGYVIVLLTLLVHDFLIKSLIGE